MTRSWRRRILALAVVAAVTGATLPEGIRAAAPSTPAVGECRPQSSGQRPNPTADDIVDCTVEQATPTRLRVRVAYTYASPFGSQNIWMGADVLAGGTRLKWFGFRPAAITKSSGIATIEVLYGQNNPPPGRLETDQVEFFMYVGGGQIFYRRLFTLRHTWHL
ncbi:MAG: hypothetical protein QN168_09525 [Armatimonadota bacterium]|nr:hypothetical protein [Armatimonadota bacterium]